MTYNEFTRYLEERIEAVSIMEYWTGLLRAPRRLCQAGYNAVFECRA